MEELQQLTTIYASPRLNHSGIIFMTEHGHAPTPEVTHTPEFPRATDQTISLQARLLIGGETLSPTKTDLAQATKQTLETGVGSSQIIEQASLVERDATYSNEDFEENKRVWSEAVKKRFSDHPGFWNGAKGKAFKETFTRIGINTDTLNPDHLYDQFFSDESTPSHEQFVNHVLSSYTNDQGILNYDQLTKDKEAITWMAGMFGTNSKDVVTELIQAKAALKTHPDAFVSAVNTAQNNTTRLNDLTAKEKHLLHFLQRPEQNLEPYVPPQPAPRTELTTPPRRQPTPIRRPTATEPVTRRREGEQTPEVVDYSRYAPQPEWFDSPERARGNYHDTSHLARVLVWTEYLSDQLIANGEVRANDLDREAMRWTAALHDIRRVNDHNDPGHTERAGVWARENLKKYIPDISDETLTMIFVLTHVIDKPIRDIPAHLQPMAKILKNADGLELARDARPGKGASVVEDRYLYSDVAKRSKQQAEAFARATANQTFDQVIAEARRRGLLTQEATPTRAVPRRNTNTPPRGEIERLNQTVHDSEQAFLDMLNEPQLRMQERQERQHTAQEATKLIDYTTGEITNEHIDLSQSYPSLVEATKVMLEHGQTEFRSGTVVFSDAAKAMIDRIAQEANNKNQELGFILDGRWVTHNNKKVFVAAYAVPAMHYNQAEDINTGILPEIYSQRAKDMAEKTNLKNYFMNSLGYAEGETGPTMHIHQDQLGRDFRGRPSQQDNDQVARLLTEDPQTPQSWGVVTKSGNDVHMGIYYSTMQNGQPHHDLSLYIPEGATRIMARPYQ